MSGTVETAGGSRLWISPTPVVPQNINNMTDQNAIAFFEGINDWIEVEGTENLGRIGDAAQASQFMSLKGQRVLKLKGPRDAGNQVIRCGRLPLDDGQAALVAAEKTRFNYPLKIELPDALGPTYTNSLMYYAALILDRPTDIGGAADVVMRSFTAGINTSVYEALSELAPT